MTTVRRRHGVKGNVSTKGNAMFVLEAIAERAIFLSVVFGLAFLVSLWVWNSHRSTKSFLAAIILFFLVLLPWILGWLVETETDRARGALFSLVDAVKRSDVAGVLAKIDDSYQDGQRDKPAIENLVRNKLPSADIEEIELRGLEWAWIDDDIQASFVANVRGRYQGHSSGQTYPSRFKIMFTKSSGTWRVESIKRYDLIQSANEIPLDRVP